MNLNISQVFIYWWRRGRVRRSQMRAFVAFKHPQNTVVELRLNRRGVWQVIS